ncbi:Aspartyl/glutamyl-tRNA(Asn/Gln) amidotransferase subunit B [Babesia sp. Xinjiang]|uniref:Aspartyl/glutamyl-tRNA(Asn/Gln) amidotransferase subunit B n=1 Tax=Babesia sp. Xinjiang TaxID=462227 RepID=UPI000A2526C0|nr:Aspartyl/glutamyl-tRNA(Asn/Gln) amidotransferase subunit B [Babesia sp. Xinjiang]ORM42086.1 Aspartyl/glutamyl-tRNA(Asn/Gln) amidotransferase subunit B [Babesia sp. Xinjiang]
MTSLIHTHIAVISVALHLFILSLSLTSSFIASFSSSNRLLSYPSARRTCFRRSASALNNDGGTKILAGVEAHIQLALPQKIFCNCTSTASFSDGSVSTHDQEDAASFASATLSRSQELYRRLGGIIEAILGGNNTTSRVGDDSYVNKHVSLPFNEYVSLYNTLHAKRAVDGTEDSRDMELKVDAFRRLNEFTCPVCKGEVGSLPLLSPLAVLYGLSACHTFSCTPSSSLSFDRKVYSYPDLPKRYQLTQVRNPIGTNGRILLNSGREIIIQRVNLEEDTARTLSETGQPLSLDYNRSGIGLVEVVTEASEMTVDELVECCSKIYQLAVGSGLCKGRMHEGNVRFDVNISAPLMGSKRIELKNLNSFRRIRRAVSLCLSSESWGEDQTAYVEGCNSTATRLDAIPNAWVDLLRRVPVGTCVAPATVPVGSTLKWSSEQNTVGYQREKFSGDSYLNIVDSNIPKITLNDVLFSKIISSALSDDRPSLEYLHASYPTVPLDLLSVIHKSSARIELFVHLCSSVGDAVIVAKWLVNYIVPSVNINCIDVDQLSELLNIVSSKGLNVDTARRIMPDFLSSGMRLDEYMRCHGLGLLDETATRKFVEDYLDKQNLKDVIEMSASSITRLVRDIVAASGHRLSYQRVRDHLVSPLGSG